MFKKVSRDILSYFTKPQTEFEKWKQKSGKKYTLTVINGQLDDVK